MIAKKIPNPVKSAKKAIRISELLDYITSPERENGVEKCIASGASDWFLAGTHNGRKLEMIALAEEAVRSKDPLDHWVISWAPSEVPTVDQVKQAVEIFIGHCGLSDHQYVWGFHDDTANSHVHIAVCRVHPMTHRVTQINRGFDREAAQQAIALIEHKQGWTPTENARYQVKDGVAILTENGARVKADATRVPRLSERASAVEIRTGQKSAQRRGIEDASPVIASATSWKELHEGLATIGMEYRKEGSGARIYIDAVGIKASSVDRKASLSALQQRLGPFKSQTELHHEHHIHTIDNPYQQDFAALGTDPRKSLRKLSSCRLAHSEKGSRGKAITAGVLSLDASPRRQFNRRLRWAGNRHSGAGQGVVAFALPLETNQKGWAEYQAIQQAFKADKQRALSSLKQLHDEERKELFFRLKSDKSTALNGQWSGRGKARNALLSSLAFQQGAKKAELRERHIAERKQLLGHYSALPSYRDWLAQPGFVGTIHIEDEEEANRLRSVDGFKRLSELMRNIELEDTAKGRIYRYRDLDLFRDEGSRLAILSPNSDEAILVALIQAKEKFGGKLTLTGESKFQRRVVQLALDQRISVTFVDPELESMKRSLKRNSIDSNSPRPAIPQVSKSPSASGGGELKEWLAENFECRLISPPPGTAAGAVLAVLPGEMIVLRLNRENEVGVYRLPNGITAQQGDVIEVNASNPQGVNQIQKVGRIER